MLYLPQSYSPMPGAIADQWKQSLDRFDKTAMIDAIVDMARHDRLFRRKVEWRFGLASSVPDLVAATRHAIAEATYFDDRDRNSNFEYDWEAFQIIQDYFARLIEMGALAEAMQLALELMRAGSFQVEGSDEGMMTEDIQHCLRVVFDALKHSDVPVSDILNWCDRLTQCDCVGFICEAEIRALRMQFEDSCSQG